MPGLRLNIKTRHALWVATGLLCCALIALAGIVQVAHTHADGQAVQSDCALCQTAHLVVQTPVLHALPIAVWIVCALSAIPSPTRRKRFSIFSLFTRPPPADLAFA